MKRLLLLRHAKAQPGANDRNRPLSEQGLADAAALAKDLKDRQILPDVILCSDALRTRQTAAAITDLEHVHLVPELYQAGSDDILAVIHYLSLNAKTLLVVAHNPGIAVLARLLARKQAGQCDAFPPCTLADFSVTAEEWHALMPKDCKLENVRFP